MKNAEKENQEGTACSLQRDSGNEADRAAASSRTADALLHTAKQPVRRAESAAASLQGECEASEALPEASEALSEASEALPGKSAPLVQKNETEIPSGLKARLEGFSGLSMDEVKVHSNPGKPANLQALAYAQGADIHVAPGQERHLPHESWHVVQQMTGRVTPTAGVGGMPVTDDAGPEHEAGVAGAKANDC